LIVSQVEVNGLRVKNVRDSYGGPVWCLAHALEKDTLAVGCEDGTVKLFR
jgi:hypothetical protein